MRSPASPSPPRPCAGRRALLAALAAGTLALLGACGSSGEGSQTSGPGAAQGSTSTTGTGARGTRAARGGSGRGRAAPPAASLKFTKTPKYAAPSSSAPIRRGVVPVAYRNVAIFPDTLRVKVGSTIRWTNYDPLTENVTSENGPIAFASKTFGKDGTFEVNLDRPGVIHYESTSHPATMNGTIEVVR